MVLGDGYNVYSPAQEPSKELDVRLKEMYEYEENRQRRMDGSGVRFG